MDVVDIARWQFGITTVYHFLFVPITIGTTAVIAWFETRWVRTGEQEYLRLAKFFGTLFLINFAIGVVTGIVQEFQFGMNWSAYSRFVGDVFGAPLAVEALLAFFLESTFIGLWIFGWDRLPRSLHAATMWLVHLGTLFSSWFILAANSWMQHPVGYTYDARSGRAELTDFWAVMANKVQLVTFPHVILAAYMTAGAFVCGVSAFLWLRRSTPAADLSLYRRGVRTGATLLLVAGLGVAVTGDLQGKVMTEVQPMKMAAAEALYRTEQPASFSVFTIGTPDGRTEKFAVKIPHLLSFLATGSTSGRVEGIEELSARYQQEYGQDPGAGYYSPGDYVPDIPVTYWTFRFMIGVGALAALIGAALLLVTRRPDRRGSAAWMRLALATPVLVVLASSFGWLFTELGRQPWAVFGVLTTAQSVSPGVSTTEAWISVVTLTLLYGVLAVVELRLLAGAVRAGAAPYEEPPDPTLGGDPDQRLTFAY